MIMEELLEPWYALTPAERAEKIREGLRRDWATGGGGHSCSIERGVPSGEGIPFIKSSKEETAVGCE